MLLEREFKEKLKNFDRDWRNSKPVTTTFEADLVEVAAGEKH